MRGVVSGSLGMCRVLEVDCDLSDAVPPARREQAVRECIATSITIPAGPWRTSRVVLPAEGIGLLVLSGLLIRRVGIYRRFGTELLGAGDLLRPWQADEESPTLPVTARWKVIEPARMAVLDETFVLRLGRYPQLSGPLIGRALQRSRSLAVNMAIVQQARVDTRLHMILWHLAARWGRVRHESVHLPLRLTHSMLADLVAARRPTVTSALSELDRQRLVHHSDDGWELYGKPPRELLQLVALPQELRARLAP
jgi:CRP/FNR family transcriptional regulator, cyclic AMP receptor protein